MVIQKQRFRGVKQNLKRARAFWDRNIWKLKFRREKMRKPEKIYLKKEKDKK